MKSSHLAFVYTPEIEGLSYPAECPFKTRRAGQVRQRLRSFGLLGTEHRREVLPQPVTRDELERFHDPAYLDELERAAQGQLTVEGLHMGLGGPDTPVFPDLYEYGRWACGAALTAADLLLRREADIVFSLMGGFHHAMAAKAGGFCYLNDAVLACERFAAAGQRVFYLDVDAHHGDGVQEAFYARSDVMTMSLHESGQTLYPWGGFAGELGEGPGRGYNVNVPLPAETYDEAYLEAFRQLVPPLLGAFNPDVLVLELGMDTLAGDPLTHLALTNNAHVDLIEMLRPFRKPTLVLGGGGYHVENTVRGWARAWKTFAGEEQEDWGYGLGGVMLENTDWAGGLRDRTLPVLPETRRGVDAEIRRVIGEVAHLAFPLHGLPVPAGG